MDKRLFLIVSLILFAIFNITYGLAEDSVFKLTSVSGKVLVKIYPSTEWKEAAVGQVCKARDYIKTEQGSKAMLELPDKSSIALKPNTEISIEELVWNDTSKKCGINMTTGEMRTIIKKLNTPSEFKIKTPTAICGAKGTIFYIVVLADGTQVYVEEGLVEFLSTLSDESYTVYEGMTSDSNQGGSISEPRELSREEIEQLIADYNDLKAEPYTPPEGGGGPPADNIPPPDVIEESIASKT